MLFQCEPGAVCQTDIGTCQCEENYAVSPVTLECCKFVFKVLKISQGTPLIVFKVLKISQGTPLILTRFCKSTLLQNKAG
jgi:hypothetical protein